MIDAAGTTLEGVYQSGKVPSELPSVAPEPEFIPEPISDDVVLKVRAMLGIQKKSWDRVSTQSLREIFPRFGLTKIVARVSLATGFESLDHAATVTKLAREIMENADGQHNPVELRLAAGKVVAISVEAMGKMFPQLMALAEAAADHAEKDEAKRHKNLPPQVTANVQVNVGGSSTSPGVPPTTESVVKTGSSDKKNPAMR